MSSFTGRLGSWAADHADEIFKLDIIDALTAYVRVSFSLDDLKGKYLYALIKLDQYDKFLHEYTREFKSSYSRIGKTTSPLRPRRTYKKERKKERKKSLTRGQSCEGHRIRSGYTII